MIVFSFSFLLVLVVMYYLFYRGILAFLTVLNTCLGVCIFELIDIIIYYIVFTFGSSNLFKTTNTKFLGSATCYLSLSY